MEWLPLKGMHKGWSLGEQYLGGNTPGVILQMLISRDKFVGEKSFMRNFPVVEWSRFWQMNDISVCPTFSVIR